MDATKVVPHSAQLTPVTHASDILYTLGALLIGIDQIMETHSAVHKEEFTRSDYADRHKEMTVRASAFKPVPEDALQLSPD